MTTNQRTEAAVSRLERIRSVKKAMSRALETPDDGELNPLSTTMGSRSDMNMEMLDDASRFGKLFKKNHLLQERVKNRSRLNEIQSSEQLKVSEARLNHANTNLLHRAMRGFTAYTNYRRWMRDQNQLADHHYLHGIVIRYFNKLRDRARRRVMYEQAAKYREFVLKKTGLKAFITNLEIIYRRRNQRMQSKHYEVLNTLRKYFRFWSIKAKLIVEQRELQNMRKATQHDSHKLQRKTFGSILHYVNRKRYERAMEQEADRFFFEKYGHKYFEALRLYRSHRIAIRDDDQRANTFHNRKLRSKCLNHWISELICSNRQKAFELEAARIHLFNLQRKYFNIWWHQTEDSVVSFDQLQSAIRFDAFRLMYRSFKVLVSYKRHRDHKNQYVTRADNMNSFLLTNRYFSLWKRAKTILEANRLDEHTANTFHYRQCVRKWFHRWKLAHDESLQSQLLHSRAETFCSHLLCKRVFQALSLHVAGQKVKDALIADRVKIIQQQLNRFKLRRIFDCMKQYYHSKMASNLDKQRARTVHVNNLVRRGLKALVLYVDYRHAKKQLQQQADSHYQSVLHRRTVQRWGHELNERRKELTLIQKANMSYMKKLFDKFRLSVRIYSRMKREKHQLALQAHEKHQRILLERGVRQLFLRGVPLRHRQQIQRCMPISMESVTLLARYFSLWRFHTMKRQEKRRIVVLPRSAITGSTLSPSISFVPTVAWKRPQPRRPFDIQTARNDNQRDLPNHVCVNFDPIAATITQFPSPNTTTTHISRESIHGPHLTEMTTPPKQWITTAESILPLPPTQPTQPHPQPEARVRYLTAELLKFFQTKEPNYQHELKERMHIKALLSEDPENKGLQSRLTFLEQNARQFLHFKKNVLPRIHSELHSIKEALTT